jgi:hypothetical protein
MYISIDEALKRANCGVSVTCSELFAGNPWYVNGRVYRTAKSAREAYVQARREALAKLAKDTK